MYPYSDDREQLMKVGVALATRNCKAGDGDIIVEVEIELVLALAAIRVERELKPAPAALRDQALAGAAGRERAGEAVRPAGWYARATVCRLFHVAAVLSEPIKFKRRGAEEVIEPERRGEVDAIA
jgi:hypothetical protein